MRSDRYNEVSKPKKKTNRTLLKVLLVFILLLLVAIPATVYYMYRSAEDSLAVSVKKEKAKFEIGENIASSAMIASSEGDVKAS